MRILREEVVANYRVLFYKEGRCFYLTKTIEATHQEVEKVNLGSDKEEARLDFQAEVTELAYLPVL
jgi:hypothetical protein